MTATALNYLSWLLFTLLVWCVLRKVMHAGVP